MKIRSVELSILLFALERSTTVSSFTTPILIPSTTLQRSSLFSTSTSSDSDKNNNDGAETPSNDTAPTKTVDPSIPLTFSSMVRQSCSAIEDAYAAGITRQTVRVLLPRTPNNDRLGQYYEDDADVDGTSENSVLVPPDETWQGGIMQLYRAASATSRAVLRLYAKDVGGVVSRLREDRSIDETGVDGMGLWFSEGATPKDDVCCFVQPSQETVQSIEKVSNEAGSDRLVLITNPQWRITDDALDSASRSSSPLGSLAKFLGGKGGSVQTLERLGFQSTYIIEGYVCKGGNVRLWKRFDTDWYVFAENDAGTDYIQVGSMKTRPTYQDVDKMLDEKGITLKYARDMGLAPKL